MTSGRSNKQVVVTVYAFLVALFMSMSMTSAAQNASGSVVGTVTDVTGASIPGATVTLTNPGTNQKQSVKTNASGEYRFLDLVPATYRLNVEAQTFKQSVIDSAAVQVDRALRLDVTMQIGVATETVEVTTQQALLQTDSGTLGYGVEGKQVEEMPLNGRNVLNLIGLVPGVVPQGDAMGSAGENQVSHTANGGWGNYQISGGMSGQSAQYIDGSPNNVLGGNGVALVITQDTVQEFRVQTNSVSPEFGRFGGGVVEFSTKAGTNRYHGTVYEYFRNKSLNANNFFNNNNSPAVRKGLWNQNQFGAALNGPLKKDKAFFLFSWEGFKSLLAVPNPTNVPTAAMQNGVFSKPITDPSGRCAIVQNAAAGTWTIPQTCWDSTAKIIKTYFPAPLTPNNPLNNYYVAPPTGTNTNQYTGRVDYKPGEKQRIFARYTFWHLQDFPPLEFGNFNGFQTGNAFSQTSAHQAVVGDTYTINSTTIADLRVSYMRSFYNQVPPSLGVGQAQFGPAFAALAAQETFFTLPTPGLSGPDNLYAFGATTLSSQNTYNTYAVRGNLLKVLGSHTFNLGGEGRMAENSGINDNSSSGKFNFTNNYFNGAPGDEFAAFLLGEFSTDSIGTAERTNTYNLSGGFYAADNWQVNRKLTLNLGLRWELPGGTAENHNRGTELLPTTFDPGIGYTGTLGVLNSAFYPHTHFEPIRYNLFSPRFGFAQTLGKNTVVRGGYGLVFLPPDLPAGSIAAGSTINSATTSVVNPTTGPTTFLSNPFPNGILQPAGNQPAALLPTSSTYFMKARLGQSIAGPVPNQPFPYMQQWNITLAQQLGDKFMFQAGYVAAKGTFLPTLGSWGLDELGSQNYTAAGTTPGGVSLTSTAPCAAYGGTTVSVGQCLRPYPQFQNFSNSIFYSASSTYNALQAQAQLRFHSGSLLTANYTWGKIITDTDTLNGSDSAQTSGTGGAYQDFNNKKGERSISSFNVPQRVTINYVMKLPFGKGQRFGGNFSGVADKVISGWAFNGITTFQIGFPLALSVNGGNTLSKSFGAGTIRPNYMPGCNKKVSGSPFQRFKAGTWFNASCFTNPGSFAFGNEPRVDPTLQAQGINNYDFSLLKATPVRDSIDVQFRMEFFNIFNHPQLAAPGISLGGANYNVPIYQLGEPRLIQASLRVNF